MRGLAKARLGIDIGGTSIRLAAVDSDDRVVDLETEPTPHGERKLLSVLGCMIGALRERYALTGVGVGIPGLVDQGVVRNAVNLGIVEVALAEQLERITAIPVVTANDVTAAALGAWMSDGKRRNLAYLNLGTGVAAGFVVDGSPWGGAHGLAGEIGHIPYLPDGGLCVCGQRGCLELIASGAGLASRWPSAGSHPIQEVLKAKTAGDSRAIVVWDQFVSGVLHAIRTIVVSLDIDVVIGGGLTRVGEPLQASVRVALEELERESAFLRTVHITRRVEFVDSAEPLGCIGAAALVTRGAGRNRSSSSLLLQR